MTYTTEFTEGEKELARNWAEANARVDNMTQDPDNVVSNKAASRIAEQAFVRAASDEADATVEWVAEDEDFGAERKFDAKVGGLKIDVKGSTNSEDRCNLMLADYLLEDGRDVDAFALVRVEPDLSSAEVYGFVTREEFEEKNHFFPPVGSLRMMNDELNPVGEL